MIVFFFFAFFLSFYFILFLFFLDLDGVCLERNKKGNRNVSYLALCFASSEIPSLKVLNICWVDRPEMPFTISTATSLNKKWKYVHCICGIVKISVSFIQKVWNLETVWWEQLVFIRNLFSRVYIFFPYTFLIISCHLFQMHFFFKQALHERFRQYQGYMETCSLCFLTNYHFHRFFLSLIFLVGRSQ